MKEKMYSRASNSLLHDHIIDGYLATDDGIEQLRTRAVITEQEYIMLLRKNIARLRQRILEFRITEKLTCIAFAIMFTWHAATDTDLQIRRPRKTRRRNETEQSL